MLRIDYRLPPDSSLISKLQLICCPTLTMTLLPKYTWVILPFIVTNPYMNLFFCPNNPIQSYILIYFGKEWLLLELGSLWQIWFLYYYFKFLNDFIGEIFSLSIKFYYSPVFKDFWLLTCSTCLIYFHAVYSLYLSMCTECTTFHFMDYEIKKWCYARTVSSPILKEGLLISAVTLPII
jgi:hypothetical protein